MLDRRIKYNIIYLLYNSNIISSARMSIVDGVTKKLIQNIFTCYAFTP